MAPASAFKVMAAATRPRPAPSRTSPDIHELASKQRLRDRSDVRMRDLDFPGQGNGRLESSMGAGLLRTAQPRFQMVVSPDEHQNLMLLLITALTGFKLLE